MKIRNKKTDNFFFKYFNNNKEDENFINTIKDELYSEVTEQIKEYAKIGKIDYNTFTFILSKKISNKIYE